MAALPSMRSPAVNLAADSLKAVEDKHAPPAVAGIIWYRRVGKM